MNDRGEASARMLIHQRAIAMCRSSAELQRDRPEPVCARQVARRPQHVGRDGHRPPRIALTEIIAFQFADRIGFAGESAGRIDRGRDLLT